MPSLSYFLIDLIAPCASKGSEVEQGSNILAANERGVVKLYALGGCHRHGPKIHASTKWEVR